MDQLSGSFGCDVRAFKSAKKKSRRVVFDGIELVGTQGFEPWTDGLRVRCSTN